MYAPGQQLLVSKNTLMFYTREARIVLGAIATEDFFIYFDGMTKICTADAIIPHLEFPLPL